MTQENSTQVLEKDNLQVRLPNDIYPRFVSTFKSDPVIGPSNINKIRMRESSGGASNTLSFSQHIQEDLLYSNQIKMDADITFTFKNVKVRQDHNMLASCLVDGSDGKPFAKYDGMYLMKDKDAATNFEVDKTSTEEYKKRLIRNEKGTFITDYAERGLSPNPFQAPEMAPCCNFMNAYLASTTGLSLASNGIPAQVQMSTKFYEVLARTYSEEEIYNNWNGMLIPTKSVVRKQKFHAFEKSCPIFSHEGIIYTNFSETGGKMNFAKKFPTYLPTYWDIERDCNASTNSTLRGRLDKELGVQYTFTKEIKSKNYSVVSAVGGIKLEATGPDTATLRTVVINGYSFPSHILASSEFTDEELYTMIGDLLFFYPDQMALEAIKKEKKTPPPTETVSATYHVFYRTEPEGQSLTVSKTYTKMTSFVYNPYLSNTSTTTFSNTGIFTLDLVKNPNLRELIEYVGAVSIVDNRVGTSSDVIMDISCTNLHIELTQYTVLAMATAIQPKTILFFNSLNKPQDIKEKVTVDADFVKTKKKSITFEHNNLSVGSDLPSRIYFYFDGGVLGAETYGIRIKNIKVTTSNGSGTEALFNRSELELAQLSRSVAFKSSYGVADCAGYNVPYKTTTGAARLGSGSILAVDISDMGFSSQLLSVGGLSGKSLMINYTIKAEIELAGRKLGDVIDIRSNVVHVTNSSLVITNSYAERYNNLFTQAEVVSAIDKFRENAIAGKLFMSNRRYFGGSFLSGLLKARYLVPKLISGINSGVGIANKVVDGAQSVMGAVNSVNDRVNTAKNFFRI